MASTSEMNFVGNSKSYYRWAGIWFRKFRKEIGEVGDRAKKG